MRTRDSIDRITLAVQYNTIKTQSSTAKHRGSPSYQTCKCNQDRADNNASRARLYACRLSVLSSTSGETSVFDPVMRAHGQLSIARPSSTYLPIHDRTSMVNVCLAVLALIVDWYSGSTQ